MFLKNSYVEAYVHTDCHFRFDACFREIRAYFDVLRILKTSK